MPNIASMQISPHDKPTEFEFDNVERNILLIGPSQNGKSSLANFLFSGQALDQKEKPDFPIGNGIESCTDRLSTKPTLWLYRYLPPELANNENVIKDNETVIKNQKTKCYIFKIIDTPGIGDTDEESEQAKMQEIYENLLNIRKSPCPLSMVLLVIKYPSLLNKQLERNITFYRYMLPNMMGSNFFLILTHVERNEHWVKTQMKGGKKNPADIVKTFSDEVQKIMGNGFLLTTETIDTMCDSDSEEEKNAQYVRDRIFETCISAPRINLNFIRLPKTILQLNQDKQEIERLLGEKQGIVKGINLMESKLSEKTKQINEQSTKMQELEQTIKEKQNELNEKDNENHHQFLNQTFTNKWHFLYRWQSKTEFDIQSKYPIKSKIVVGGNAIYIIDEEKHIQGRLYSPFWKDLNCHLNLFTLKYIYFEEDIKQLNVILPILKKEFDSIKTQFNDKSGEAVKFEKQLFSFRENINDIDRKIKILSLDYICSNELNSGTQNELYVQNRDASLASISTVDINTRANSEVATNSNNIK